MLNLDSKKGMLLLANSLHCALGALVAWGTVAIFCVTPLWSVGPVIAFTSAKEYWWDIRYETQDTSGGYVGGLKDQAGYIAGWIVAYAIWRLAHWRG